MEVSFIEDRVTGPYLFYLKKTRKSDKIYKTTVSRHWTTARTGL